ncbi:MAG: amino acid adenylation domain-containing protein [Cyanobacteria bacterium J06560_2]
MKNVADIYPLSPVQLGMLFHTLAQDTSADSGVYINQYTCELKGTVNLSLFQLAWQQTVDRHPVLRTAFLWEGLDDPLQVVRQQVDLPWQVLELVSEQDWANWIEDFLMIDRTQGFNLAKAPLLRLTLIPRDNSITQLVWTSHHMLFDGWSLPLIWQDMLTYYEALLKDVSPQLEPLRPYRDYIAWQQNQDTTASELFWRSQLQGFTAPTSLPAALTVADNTRKGYSQQSIQLKIDSLTAFARAQRLTLNTLVQGAWALLLHHYSSQARVMYGSVVSGRPALLKGVEKMVGLFINTLPVCTTIDGEEDLVDWLQGYQQQLLDLRSHEATALSDLQRWSNIPAGSSLFESIVVFENYPASTDSDVGFTVENARYIEQSNYPLALLVVPGESLELILLYDLTRFEQGAIARLLKHLDLLLTAFIKQPQAKLSELPRLTAEERNQLAKEPNSSEYDDLTIHQLIEAQVERVPTATAVVFEGKSLSYGALNERAEDLARELRSRGVSSGDRVAVCLNRSLDMVSCILAVLKTGAAYVPLDPSYPASRLDYCMQDTGPKIVCTERSVQLLAESVPRLYVDNPLTSATARSDENPQQVAQPKDAAYIIYTSGSTGQPKGVVVSHRNLVHSTTARFSVYSNPVGCFLLLSSIAFDSSVAGLFWTLCQGGTLVIAPQRIEQDLQQLIALISRERVTHTLCVPTLYNLLLNETDLSLLATLQTVIVAGEACSRSLATQHHEKLPNTQLYNEYGPTEATVWCTAYRVPKALPPGPVAIGSTILGAQILLLNAHLQPVPTGAIGEIYIGGPGVAQRYLNQPEKTAAAFLSEAVLSEDPLQPLYPSKLYKTGDLGRKRADGSFEWLGRSDRQVKVRGYRIELGEIEEVLRSQPNIQSAVVVAREAYQFSAAPDAEDTERLLRALQECSYEEADALLSSVEARPEEIAVEEPV